MPPTCMLFLLPFFFFQYHRILNGEVLALLSISLKLSRNRGIKKTFLDLLVHVTRAKLLTKDKEKG